MDELSGKRTIGGNVIPRRGSSLVLRDTTQNKERSAQFCNRLGCNGRLNYTRGSQIGNSEKPKSSSGKEIIGSSARNCSVITKTRKSIQESRKKLSSHLETDSSETSSVEDESRVSEIIPSSGNIQIGLRSKLKYSESREDRLMEVGSSGITSNGRLMEVGSSGIASNGRSPRILQQKSGLSSQDTLLGSSIPLASKSTCQGARNNTNASRYGLRNLRCSSISDVLPSGCSSSEPNLSRRNGMVKKRNPEGESSSSARGKKMIGPSAQEKHGSFSTSGISISDSRRARNWPPSRDNGVVSVRTRRSIIGNTGTGLSNEGNGNNVSLIESSGVIPQVPQPEIPSGVNVPSSLHQFSVEASSSHSNFNGSSSTSGGNMPIMIPTDLEEHGITRSSMYRNGLRRYNMDGIAEVLLALERIEQDEELTYEQLLALETNLFLGDLGFYDQHRDMRLDIDNMSYEELLALEDKMGTVSTALPEEALSKCLKRSIYQTISPREGIIGCNGDEDDTKCSICQEDYVVGDEMGRLECDHGYHMACIHQWLRLKNWCPICKGSAA